MENLGKWLFWLGALVAVVGAFVTIPFSGLILAVVGLVIGILRWNMAMDQGFVLAALGLAASAAALDAINVVGPWITAIAGGLWAMVGAALLVAVVKALWDWGNK